MNSSPMDWKGLVRFGLVVAAIFTFLSFGRTARADNVTYTFTGAGLLAGTSFTYVSPSGFLSSPTGMLTVSPGGVLAGEAIPTQTLLSFAIFPDPSIPVGFEVLALTGDVFPDTVAVFAPFSAIDLTAFSTVMLIQPNPRENPDLGTLVIAPTAAPEPSSLPTLLCAFGLVLVVRVTGLFGLRFGVGPPLPRKAL